MCMKNIYQMIETLAATSGSNAKKELMNIIDYTDLGWLFKRVCYATYEPTINYYVRKYDDAKTHYGIMSLDEAIDELDKLSSRQLTGNAALSHLTFLSSQLDEDDSQVLRKIIAGDLRCGISIGTINKIWPGLIYTHPYMRCNSFNEKNLKNIKFPCFSQTKEDGLYFDAVVKDNKVVYRSRNGSYLDLLNCKETDSKFISGGNDLVYMGEALVFEEDFSGVMDRKSGNGYLNSDTIDPSRVLLVVWDQVPYEDYIKRKCSIPYTKRFASLEKFTNQVQIRNIRLIDSKIVNKVEEIVEHFKENVQKYGLEGTVVKNFSTVWESGTSKDQVKVKIEFECELKVVGKKEGSGKNVGKLGALLCESAEGLIEVSAGGGYSDPQRIEFWEDENIIGKIVTVKSNDIIQNQNNLTKRSLFLPRFVEVRYDKDEADSFDRVKEQRDAFVDTLKAIK